MWTDLFELGGSHAPTPSVDRVDRVDDMSTPVPIPPLVGAAASPASVAKCVDRVDPGKADLVGTPLLISVSSPPDVAPGGHSPHGAMPTASASNESTQSTQSTQSTPGIFCRLLTAAQKNAFLALFEPDLDLIEIETRAAGNDTTNELRRAVNVVWRLLTVEELDFNTAITKATEWVVAQPMHPDELLFADVLTFSKRHDEK